MGLNKQIFEDIRELENKVFNGELNALETYIFIDELSTRVESAKDNIKDSAIKEREKYPEKKAETFGCITEICQRTTYDYKHIEEWNKKKIELETIQENAKQARLNLDKGINTVVENSGEIIEPAISKSTTYIKIQLPK